VAVRFGAGGVFPGGGKAAMSDWDILLPVIVITVIIWTFVVYETDWRLADKVKELWRGWQ